MPSLTICPSFINISYLFSDFAFKDDDGAFTTVYKFALLPFQRFRSSETINQNLKDLSERNIRWLTKEQLQGIPTDLLTSLTVERLGYFSLEQVSHFTTAQQEIYFSKTSSRRVTNDKDLVLNDKDLALNDANSWTADLFAELPEEQINAILPAEVETYGENALEKVKTFNFKELKDFFFILNKCKVLHKLLVEEDGAFKSEFHAELSKNAVARLLYIQHIDPNHVPTNAIKELYSFGHCRTAPRMRGLPGSLASCWTPLQIQALINNPEHFSELASEPLFIQDLLKYEEIIPSLNSEQTTLLLNMNHTKIIPTLGPQQVMDLLDQPLETFSQNNILLLLERVTTLARNSAIH